MKQFMDKDLIDIRIGTDTAKELFHGYAEKAPVLDYHCHIDRRRSRREPEV